jgi:two-component system sensor histidine kinase ChvG
MKLFARAKPVRDTVTANSTDVVLGEDWVSPEDEADSELAGQRKRRRSVVLNHSPLARRIITFNLLALIVLVAGVLYLNPFRDSLVTQRQAMLGVEAKLLASMFETALPADLEIGPSLASKREARRVLSELDLRGNNAEAFLFDLSGEVIASTLASGAPLAQGVAVRSTPITDLLKAIWSGMSKVLRPNAPVLPPADAADTARQVADMAARSGSLVHGETARAVDGVFATAAPVTRDGVVVGVVALASSTSEIDAMVQGEREQVLQVFFTAVLVSIALSLVLASTIANPLADLATAAEMGRDRHARKMSPSRVRIPDLTARPDEIGRLSGALRGMVAALYDRIEANEQFAADVAHEIKNPLASLRSAVGTLRLAQRDDQRTKLLDVIEHDVRRLDRLISDISNASRLDAELVKEDEEAFDLIKMLSNISTHFRQEASERGVEFITDLPSKPIIVTGLEARLAQVFVNLISNAVSFCEDGDAVRVWTRRRENRVLVVVEDTGPGIPEEALQKIFKRFYSERPAGQFGKHSGLGLAISKQIVEAHGGVIWAENIRPTDADLMSEPLGARFVVGIPV